MWRVVDHRHGMAALDDHVPVGHLAPFSRARVFLTGFIDSRTGCYRRSRDLLIALDTGPEPKAGP